MSMDARDDESLYAYQEQHVFGRRAQRFTEVLRQQELAGRPDDVELSDEAKRSVAEFERDAAALDALVDAEADTLLPLHGPLPDFSDLFAADAGPHVFGPHNYSLGWVHQGDGGASVDLPAARISAYNYTTGPARFTVAQLGVKLRPSSPVCKLSVRVYARYRGYDILKHRVHQPGTTETRWAWALGSVGVKVDSRKLDGSGYHLDDETWVDVWDRSGPNPSGSLEYGGTLSVSDGLILEPLAVDTREYSIWVTCRVGVSADHGFMVSTYATSNIACEVPYFVVEEIENW